LDKIHQVGNEVGVDFIEYAQIETLFYAVCGGHVGIFHDPLKAEEGNFGIRHLKQLFDSGEIMADRGYREELAICFILRDTFGDNGGFGNGFVNRLELGLIGVIGPSANFVKTTGHFGMFKNNDVRHFSPIFLWSWKGYMFSIPLNEVGPPIVI